MLPRFVPVRALAPATAPRRLPVARPRDVVAAKANVPDQLDGLHGGVYTVSIESQALSDVFFSETRPMSSRISEAVAWSPLASTIFD